MSLLAGISVAAAAAVALNASYLVQHAGLASAPRVRASRPLATVRALLRSRTWLVGASLGYVGLALNTVALGLAPLSLVQSVVAAGLVVVVVGASCARRQAPGLRTVAAVALIVPALAGLAIGARPTTAHAPAAVVLLGFLTLAGLLAAAIVRPNVRLTAPQLLGLAAGVLYGATNVALAALLAAGPTIWTAAVAIAGGAAVTVGGFFAFQRGLQAGPPIGVVTLMTAGTNVIAIVGGLAVMGDALGATPALAAVHVASFVMVVLGGALAASELSGVCALADLQETAMPRVPPKACPSVLDRVG